MHDRRSGAREGVTLSVPRSVVIPAGVSKVRLDVPGGSYAALRAEAPDSARPPVLLVPGFTGSKEDFLPLLPLLAEAGHTAVSIDLRGQFESEGPDDPTAYGVEPLAVDVRAVLDQVAAGGRAHVVGHSYGGLVVRRMLLDRADGVASLTLLGSGPAAIGGQRATILQLMRPLLAERGQLAVWEASEQLAANDPKNVDRAPEIVAFLKRRFLASTAAGLHGMGEALLSEPDRVDQLRDLGLPTLVAHGAEDDAWPPPVQQEMARRLGARYEVVPDALHSPAVENPHATARVLTDFWTSVDAG